MNNLLPAIALLASAEGQGETAVPAAWGGWLVQFLAANKGLLFLLLVLLSIGLAWVIARLARSPDMWGRVATVLLAMTMGGAVCWLGWPNKRLGIDLKGGLILVYEVAAGREAEARIDECAAAVERIVAEQASARATLTREGARRLVVRLAGDAAGRDAFQAAIGRAVFDRVTLREVARRETGDGLQLEYEVVPDTQAVPMDKLVAAIKRRVNPGGQKEVTVRQFGVDQVEVILPDVAQEEVEQVKRLISSAGVLEFRILANRADTRPEHSAAIALAEASRSRSVRNSEGLEIARWVGLAKGMQDDPTMVTRLAADGQKQALVLVQDERRTVTGADLSQARPDIDESAQRCVSFMLNSRGAAKFGLLTSGNLPDPASGLASRLGIVLDDVLQSAPAIRSTITSSGQITGGFSQADVEFLVEVLNAGSLPAALEQEPSSEQRISAQLGEDTIKSAGRAMLLATVVVLTFMLAYYRFSGLVADLAVLLNVVLVVALMFSFKVAFTLAGLAGLVLSVGMAVDANVLIYERIREEIDRGAAVRMAIRNGFQRAFSTIVDSNLTSLITAAILFAIGTDQLKGFAVALFLGLLVNLFTAVFCSRVVFDLAERSRLIRRLSMARLLTNPSLRFVRWARPAAVLSLVLIALGAVAAARRGSELFDIDFTGGTSVQVEFKERMPIADVRRILTGEFKSGKLESVTVSGVTAADGTAERRFKIDTSNQDEQQVERLLQEAFPNQLTTYGVEVGVVGPGPDAAVAAAAEAATEKPAADAARLVTAVPLTFPGGITREALAGKVEKTLEAESLADAEFDLQPGEPPGESARAAAGPPRLWILSTSLDAEGTRRVVDRMAREFAETPAYLSVSAIGGKVAGNTQWTALTALGLSLALIVLYIWVRFQNLAFGVAAVAALAHDVLVALACLAASRFLSPYLGWAQVDPFRISLDVVAALLTIIGFSINDTIVIFDRLREIRGKAKFVTAEMVDRAVNQTLSRTILTSGTALLAVLVLYAVGGPGIHAFAFTMLVGVITGTYSTVYIAAPLVLLLQHRLGAPADVGRTVTRPA